MFEVIGSWLDWKKSEISAVLSNIAFEHEAKKLDKVVSKEKAEKVSKENKDDKDSTVTATTKEEPAAAETTAEKVKEDVDENIEDIFSNISENLSKISSEEDEEMKNLMSDITEILQRIKNHSSSTKEEDSNDPAESEHPEDDAPVEQEKEEKNEIDALDRLKEISNSELARKVYGAVYENAEELSKYTTSPDQQVSEEEANKLLKQFNDVFRPILAKTLVGNTDVNLDRMEDILVERLGSGTLNGTIQTAFTTWGLDKNKKGELPEDYKPLMTFAEEALNGETAATKVEPSTTTNTTKRSSNSRRKK